MTQYATMVGAICLDKFTDYDGNPAPITYNVKKVMNGHDAWETGGGTHCLEIGFRSLEEAIQSLHYHFLIWLEREPRDGSFWKENYQGMRSKWQTWAKKQKHSFAYDNYKVCIVTSAGNIVY